MATTTSRRTDEAPDTELPTLETGDRLSADEFHRRYLLRPDIHKAELINGVVYVASPTRSPNHGQPHLFLSGIFADYVRSHPDVRGDSETSIRQYDDSEIKPDLLLRIPRSAGGGSWIGGDGYVRGAPELVAEIAASSVSYDLHDKKQLYRRMGVREYIVWRVEDEAIDWWALRDGEWQPLPAGTDGVVSSEVFPGLSIDVPGLLRVAKAAREQD